jgi:hypothetical protein
MTLFLTKYITLHFRNQHPISEINGFDNPSLTTNLLLLFHYHIPNLIKNCMTFKSIITSQIASFCLTTALLSSYSSISISQSIPKAVGQFLPKTSSNGRKWNIMPSSTFRPIPLPIKNGALVTMTQRFLILLN